jgi:basic amino acid/polyamine antiporter, APA family
MLGAGVFAAVAPAAEAAGSMLLMGLALAAVVSYANATSSAQLAALYPEAGGTYVYARERLGDYWGFVAGWAFVIGKTASLVAITLTFGSYIDPGFARPLGLTALAVLTALNYRGIEKTARASLIFVVVVLAALIFVVTAAVLGGNPSVANFSRSSPEGWLGVLRSAGILFFAFAGYARIATLGEEVVDPARTIPRAIPAALGIAVAVYSAVMVSALAAVGPERLANSESPLLTVVEASGWRSFSPVVRVGAAAHAAGCWSPSWRV